MKKSTKKKAEEGLVLYYQDVIDLTESKTEDEFYSKVFLQLGTSSVKPVMGGISIRPPDEFAVYNMPHIKFVTRIFGYVGLGEELDVNI